MKKLLLLSMTLLFILTGCNTIDEKNDSNPKKEVVKAAAPLKAEITLSNQANTGEKTKLTVDVSQSGKPIDASEVIFEIIKAGENTKQMIQTEKSQQGKYVANHIFQTAGTYRITAHVTASNMHTMPENEITIVQSEENNDTSIKKNSSSVHQHSHVEFEFNPEASYSLGKHELLVSITNDHLPLEKADVQFEVWMDDTDKHQYIPTKEINPGTYLADVRFSESGIHNIQIHVVKEEIHDHTKYQVNIQN